MTIKKSEEIIASDTYNLIDKINSLKDKTCKGSNLEKPYKDKEIKVTEDFLPLRNKLIEINNNNKLKKKSNLDSLNNYDEIYAQLFIDCEKIVDEMNDNYCSCDCDRCSCNCDRCSCNCDYCSCDCDRCSCDCDRCSCDCDNCNCYVDVKCNCNTQSSCDCHYCSCLCLCSCDCDNSCSCECNYTGDNCYCANTPPHAQGTCLINNQLIYTINKGVINIDNLEVNDQVINGYGNIDIVKSKWKIENIKNILKLNFGNNRNISLTNDHVIPFKYLDTNNIINSTLDIIYKYNNYDKFKVKIPKINIIKYFDENQEIKIHKNLKINNNIKKILSFIFLSDIIYYNDKVVIKSFNKKILYNIGCYLNENLKINYSINEKNELIILNINDNKIGNINIIDIFKSLNLNNMFKIVNNFNKPFIKGFIDKVNPYKDLLNKYKLYELKMIEDLLMEDEFLSINSIEKLDYNNTVYGLTLEKSNTLALDIVIGDGNLDV